jgi:hypothetical protein
MTKGDRMDSSIAVESVNGLMAYRMVEQAVPALGIRHAERWRP